MNKTCGDCIHYDVCMDYTTLKESKFAQHFEGSDVLCDHFKDKSRYIELPCIVGDKVYCVQPFFDHNRKKYKRVIKPKVVDFVFTLPFLAESKGEILREKDFGKTVFLTKEEAEQALKGGAL